MLRLGMWSDVCGQHNVFGGGCTIHSASSLARTTNYKMPPEEQLDKKRKRRDDAALSEISGTKWARFQ